jgi:hypothetical protein
MSTDKRVKLAEGREDDSIDNSQLSGSSEGEDTSHPGQESSRNTDDEIADGQRMKSKKTLKRKRRATEPSRFGTTLQSLLNTDAPSGLPLSLKPSVAHQKNEAKLELEAKKVIQIERKEREERGRIRDVIGGWGGESERSLRKVAQRGGMLDAICTKYFNVFAHFNTSSGEAFQYHSTVTAGNRRGRGRSQGLSWYWQAFATYAVTQQKRQRKEERS